MGAVIVRNPRPAPFSDMRKGPSNRKVLLWSRRSSDLRKAIFCQFVRGIAFLVLCLSSFSAMRSITVGRFRPAGYACACATNDIAHSGSRSNSNPCDPFAGDCKPGGGTGSHLRDISKTLLPVPDLGASAPEGKAHSEEVSRRARQAEDCSPIYPT